MVSQKSMSQISGAVIAYDTGLKQPDRETAELLTSHFNRIISHLIETDEKIDIGEFGIWRGMTAGSQAQGSWQNAKGEQVEALFRGMVEQQVKDRNIATSITDREISLKDGRTLIFSSEPDLAIFHDNVIQLAIEIKGGIDTAAVLERIGAALKSLKRAKEVNPNAITVLIMQEVAFSVQAKRDIELNKETVNHLFMLERLMENREDREVFFRVLKI